MFQLLKKIATTPKTVIPRSSFAVSPNGELDKLGGQLQTAVNKWFKGSLAIREVDAGSTNACEQELVALSNSFYDIERFGIHFVASPRHADILFVTGPVSRNMAYALRSAYEATPTPKIVVAVGDDAISGGIFKGSYAVLDGVASVIPVDFEISGDPPSPADVLRALVSIVEKIGEEKSRVKKHS
ncbi:MAG: NADH-quinone oxidoreductase subunit NuoB [Candidatus Wildermuthbacteria bacterium]|nr:NADH-quinone oxidoreductase subunit NuoB [Candidatus Wildermuthbacteria bacterium]